MKTKKTPPPLFSKEEGKAWLRLFVKEMEVWGNTGIKVTREFSKSKIK